MLGYVFVSVGVFDVIHFMVRFCILDGVQFHDQVSIFSYDWYLDEN